jgi:hypothetical protein
MMLRDKIIRKYLHNIPIFQERDRHGRMSLRDNRSGYGGIGEIIIPES